MRKLFILLLLLTSPFLVNAQRGAISIKVGYTSSSVGNYQISGYDSVYTKPISFMEIGTGYTYKIKNWFWLSIEPGLKTAGYKTTPYRIPNSSTTITDHYNGMYFNCPIISTFNIAPNKTIVALDLGYNPNFHITGSNIPSHFSEILVGLRLGYRISDRIALEGYYRYGESLSHFVAKESLVTNYIAIQTKIFLGKPKN